MNNFKSDAQRRGFYGQEGHFETEPNTDTEKKIIPQARPQDPERNVVKEFDNLGKRFPDEVVSSWIDEDGNYRVYGYDPDDIYKYRSIDHWNTTTELAEKLGIKLEDWDTTTEYGKKIKIENPSAHDDDVNELLKKTGLIRVNNHKANPHENYSSYNTVGIEIAKPPTTAQLKTLRELEKDYDEIIDFNIGDHGDFKSGEGYMELTKAINIKFPERLRLLR